MSSSEVVASSNLMIECHKRREKLAQQLPYSSIAIVAAASLVHRNSDAEYPFRQDSNFYYLTGLVEPEMVMALKKEKDNKIICTVFCRPKRPEEEVWSGPRLGVEGVKEQLAGVMEIVSSSYIEEVQAYSIEELDKMMPSLLENTQEIFYSLGYNKNFDQRLIDWVNTVRFKVRTGIRSPHSFRDLLSLIYEQRLIKSNYEINLMKKAASVSVEGHKRLMKYCSVKLNEFLNTNNPLTNQVANIATSSLQEYELEAEFLHECYRNGCRAVAYTSIIAGGKNACTLHYVNNTEPLRNGELVLVDAGGEYDYYAADITRTFPVNGKFTEAQKGIYEIVLEAQEKAIAAIRPGVRYNKMQEIIVRVLVEGMVKLKILDGSLGIEKLIEREAHRRFYMHSSGHWLGLDVHDAGEYKDKKGEWRELQPGMVLTVEPGLYIAPNQNDVDPKWWGIGIRIEDDILVTKDGHENLTKAAPKKIAEIEEFMR